MANMSYVRFQNTVSDLDDCYNSDGMWDETDLSDEEKKARNRLILLCCDIAAELGEDDE